MSSSSSKKKQQEEEVKRCGCCGRDDLALKHCSGCGSVAYCDAKCQTADWPSHKTVCNRIKKEKKAQQEKANEAHLAAMAEQIKKSDESRDRLYSAIRGSLSKNPPSNSQD